MNTKTSFILGLILLWSVTAHAEIRVIGVRLTRDADSKVYASISSDVGKERKKDITVEQAAGILRSVRRSGSSILVGIVAHDVPLQAYLPLLKEISDNQLLELVFVERQEFGFINKNIKKIIEQDSADQPATAPESKPEGKEKTEPESEGAASSGWQALYVGGNNDNHGSILSLLERGNAGSYKDLMS